VSERRALSIVVLGGGVSGLSAALALARDGASVTVVERDDTSVGDPLASVDWNRSGISHFLQPHAFGPRGRQELAATFPDVLEDLLGAGAWDFDLRNKLRGEPGPGDETLVYLAVRRPLIEWAFRRAAIAEPRLTLLGGTRATALDGAPDSRPGSRPRIRGVRTTAGSLDADLVVDAMGRRSPGPAWVEALGGRRPEVRTSECGIIYYSRYYRFRDGAAPTDGPWVPSPRGDLGYAGYSTFPGDNRTFAGLIAVPTGDPELRALRHVAAFDAAVATMPALLSWTDSDVSVPITPVLAMGGLQNTISSAPNDRPGAVGLIAVGDAICHTDPFASLGLSFALIHARLLAAAVRNEGSDTDAVGLEFDGAARPEMEERFDYVSALDDTRSRLWAGERVDVAHANGGAYPFFTYAATGLAGLADADLFRVLVRRNTMLDRLAVLDDDPEMQQRLEAFFAQLATNGRPRAGVSRDALLEAISSSATTQGAEAAGSASAYGTAR
jgi:flavin-dependent dehydrogenase